jgi:hypothetical protein
MEAMSEVKSVGKETAGRARQRPIFAMAGVRRRFEHQLNSSNFAIAGIRRTCSNFGGMLIRGMSSRMVGNLKLNNYYNDDLAPP